MRRRAEDKPAALLYLARELIPVGQPTIVFVSTRHHVDYLHGLLEKAGIQAACVYGTMDQVGRVGRGREGWMGDGVVLADTQDCLPATVAARAPLSRLPHPPTRPHPHIHTYALTHPSQAARKINVAKFRAGRVQFLVVTDVAARGIDIPLLDNVINYGALWVGGWVGAHACGAGASARGW